MCVVARQQYPQAVMFQEEPVGDFPMSRTMEYPLLLLKYIRKKKGKSIIREKEKKLGKMISGQRQVICNITESQRMAESKKEYLRDIQNEEIFETENT